MNLLLLNVARPLKVEFDMKRFTTILSSCCGCKVKLLTVGGYFPVMLLLEMQWFTAMNGSIMSTIRLL